MLTGLHEGSFGSMQLGAGLFLKGFDPDGADNASQLRQHLAAAVREGTGVIGVTRGGGVFRCVPKLRDIGADGQRGPTRGGVVLDGWTVTLSGTMLEITPDNFSMALAAASVERTGAKTTVRLRDRLSEEDYIPRLCWVGDTARGLVLIELTDVLNVAGASFVFGDEREGALPFTMQAHRRSAGGQDVLPMRIIFFAEEEPA